MSIAAALSELERSPALHDHLAHLRQIVEDESRRREQFYREIDEQTTREFINGQVVVHPPAPSGHSDAVSFVAELLGKFALRHGLGRVEAAPCLVRCQRNDYAPDLCFFVAAKAAGSKRGQTVFPPPDLVVEVLSPATENNDRTLKPQDYARHGVGEYWIIDADERMVEQYLLPPGATRYALKARLPDGAHLASTVLTGFSAPVAAFFDAERHRDALQEIAPQL